MLAAVGSFHPEVGRGVLTDKRKLKNIYFLQKKHLQYSILHDVMREDFHRTLEELLPECERVLSGVEGPGHQAGTALLCEERNFNAWEESRSHGDRQLQPDRLQRKL